MSEDKNGCLKWYSRGQHIALDVVQGLAYLHKCKVCSILIIGCDSPRADYIYISIPSLFHQDLHTEALAYVSHITAACFGPCVRS